ncbi:MAG: hypothetical protein ABI858_08450 [Pseudoxanthomonas sp.]
MHYVSKYNYFKSLDRLARASGDKPDVSEAIAGLSQFSLRDILNSEEIVIMYQQKTTLGLVKQWADSGVKIDAEAIRADLAKRERFFVPQYVMKVNTPRYHTKHDCEFLKASFENFETPPEIEQLGQDKISEFQEFCDKEWPRYRGDPIDIFWAHVGSHFRVSISPKEVSYMSEEDPESVRDRSASELIEEVHQEAKRLRTYAESNGVSNLLYARGQHLYSLTKSYAVDVARKQVLVELLKLKKAIKMLVFNFHRIELEMPEGLLSDELLEALGFLPCKACCRVR